MSAHVAHVHEPDGWPKRKAELIGHIGAAHALEAGRDLGRLGTFRQLDLGASHAYWHEPERPAEHALAAELAGAGCPNERPGMIARTLEEHAEILGDPDEALEVARRAVRLLELEAEARERTGAGTHYLEHHEAGGPELKPRPDPESIR